MRKGSKRITYNSYQKDAVYERYEGKCGICGMELSREKMTIAHKIPLSRGGDNSLNNLVLSCWDCSHAKNGLTMDEFFQKIWMIFKHNEREILSVHDSNRLDQ